MPAWEGTTAFTNGGKWRRSLRLLDLSEPVGVLMSMENGASEIGNVTGFAMAASVELRVPLPSVEAPKGADIPTKKSSYDTADNLFYRSTSRKLPAIEHCFLEPLQRE